MKKIFNKKLYVIITSFVLVLIVLLSSFTTIKTGEVGVRVRFGKVVSSPTKEGVNFKIPFIERIERVMYSFKSSAKIESRIATILEGIENAKGEAFESFHTDLGKFLGYEASNPKGSGDPDPYWILNDDICIVYEDKIYESDNHKIPLDHISQANRHEKWIREKITTLHKSATIYTVFISNTKSIEEEGRIHAEHIFYLNRKDLIQWAHTALKVVRDCYNTFPGEGDAEWRAYVKDEFVRKGITPSDFIKLITKTKLCDL